MLKKHLHSLILTATLISSYATTLAPGLTWANGGADGGDLITAAATGGIAHPSGYPLYLLLAQTSQAIPIGTLAFRTNLLSAVCSILAALALQTFLRRQNISPNIALIAGLAFGLAPAIWGQSVITEVYTLQSLLLILFLWGLLEEKIPGGEWTRGLLFGLSLSNHVTTLLLIPLLLLCAARQPQLIRPSDLIKRTLAACVVILLMCATIWLRAKNSPPVNWGNPVTLENLWWLVSGGLYATYPFELSPADIFLRLRAVGGLLLEQFTLLGVLLGIYGLFSRLPRRILLASLWMFIAFACFAIFYGSYDSQVYLMPTYLIFSIWLAYGIQDIVENIPPKLGQLTITLVVLGLMARIPLTIPSVDASHDQRAEQFGTQFIATTPQQAIIFASNDEPVFALWYFHYALGKRPDVIIIAEELIPYPWYAETLAKTYPALKISTTTPSQADIIHENPGRPICQISSTTIPQTGFCATAP